MEHEHIAIVGLGCRLPGDVDSPAALWRLLADGQDAVGPFPAGRPLPGTGTPGDGGWLRDVAGFDADFFGVSRREADVLDPQHRLMLEVVWEAFEHAGLPPDRLAGEPTGVFLGLSYDEYMHRLAGQPEELAGGILTNGHCVAAGRISYLLGLHGPAVSVDTACSSGLVAVHQAAQALRERECDLAVAGAVNLVVDERTTREFTRFGMLSPTGRCRAFDERADGFVRSEGAGAVVLKRLGDALRDGDRILAVVRGSAVNQDGRSDGLSAPSAEAQEAVYRAALVRAGLDASQVGYVEAHGTGTRLGDPTELASLTRVYGGQGRAVAIGSIKSNVGHLEPAAGIAGLIKAVLALDYGVIPGNLHFTGWTPGTDPSAAGLFVPTGTTRWPDGAAVRRAAVSSFGFSGTNAHVVLEEAPTLPSPASSTRTSGEPEVVLIPAGSREALPAAAERVADWLDGDGRDVPLRDIAHTFALRRGAGRGRLGVVATTTEELSDRLRGYVAGRLDPAVVSGAVPGGVARGAVWVFSGQGSQWTGMGRELLATEPAFAASLTRSDALIASEAGFSVLDVIRSGQPVAGCGFVQPVLFALQVALADLWRAHGVTPAGVLGHSMGEVAAAVVSGALTLADGVAVICRRSALLERIAGAGAMASVGLSRSQVEADIAAAGAGAVVSVAVVAAPESTVVAGDDEWVRLLVDAWDAEGVPARLVAVDVASHSPQVDPLLQDLTAALKDLRPRDPAVRFYSTVLDPRSEEPAFDADYWCRNLRQPVRFAAAVGAAAADRHRVFLEVSPHPIVTSAVRDSTTDAVVVGTLRRDEPEVLTFRTALAALHCSGVPVAWSALYGDADLADPPTMTYDRRRHWVDVSPVDPTPDVSGLPGRHTEVAGDPVRHTWVGDAGLDALPFLADHRVHDEAVLPGAAFHALALSAATAVFAAPVDQVVVEDLAFRELLRLEARTEVSTTVTMTTPDRAECEIFARGTDGAWVRHATAALRSGRSTTDTPTPQCDVPGDAEGLYAAMRARGIHHGPTFAGLSELARSADGKAARALVASPGAAPDALAIHPVLLDMCAQLLVATVLDEPGRGLVLPVGIARVAVTGDLSLAAHAEARLVSSDAEGFSGDVVLRDDAGAALLTVGGLRCVRQRVPEASAGEWLLEPRWAAAPALTGRAVGRVLLVGEGGGAVLPVASALRARGAVVDVVDVPLAEPVRGLFGGVLPGAVALVCGGASGADAALDRTRRAVAVAQTLCAEAVPPRLVLVTGGALDEAALRGIVRVLAIEHPELRATLVETDDAGLLADELLANGTDDEVRHRSGERLVARLAYAPVPEVSTVDVRCGVDGFRLRAGRLGDLSGLELAACHRRRPGPGEVEIQVTATGVNFRDVLTVLGLLPGDGHDVRYRIGFECAGVVSAVGAGVPLEVGESVLAVDLRGGAFGSFLTVPATAVARMPGGLDPVVAAGQLTGYLTAWYALRHVAGVRSGERVLIHSGTGGTGLAAIAVARKLGATVFATAGTPEKRARLRELGIATVMDSRTLDFAAETLEATGGEGVDVVLNSLAGPAIRAGLSTLRPFGRFVELGVRDILADRALGLAPMRHNITFSTVDLIELQSRRPGVFATVLREVIAGLADGSLPPLPVRSYPLTAATEAFRTMAAAAHQGKLVLTVPGSGTLKAARPAEPAVRGDGSYIITGGLTGVGLAAAAWLASRGAGHVVLNGRRAPSPEAAAAIADLRAGGTRVTVLRGDVAAPGTATALVEAATAFGRPLCGVLHAAMVLDDAALLTVADEQFDRVWRPKVVGARALHTAVAGQRLDWFVVFSSMASLIGNAGQTVYAAANAWLDGFASWRAAQGLPTLAVNWGPWGQTGAATDFAARGYTTIGTSEGFSALSILLAHDRVRTGVIPGAPATWVPAPASPFFADVLATVAAPEPVTPTGPTVADVRAELAAAPAGLARRTALESYVGGHVQAVMRLGDSALDPQTPLRALGFDSLLAMELRARLEAGLGVKLAGNFVWKHPTLAALAEGLAGHMDLALEPDDAA
ncbi:polyketide synthase 2/polyketide synthase 5 [Asanoa ferruginea]|uniref:Polyketide synthase 2/polyketide synthase 5 n=1 Tax=Asanoa ferruginea TaxID=53367 RepID=A0A3D9ZW39_9ACTN|nr:type I polyketide synthase [Asanoa ferruginea]REG01230.1 polyketide synthase 2/polyketide synthase 5 [Asanoa ferruginea]GIF47060.1 mycolipanoate synthase [Asanoa ferruginea]